jgi:hypothetical protein
VSLTEDEVRIRALTKRVEALEELAAYPLQSVTAPEFSEAQLAELRQALEAVGSKPPVVLPRIPPLTEEQVRFLLAACVTVVKPGETLILRCGREWTPNQMREIQEMIDHVAEWRGLGFTVLVVPADELGIANATKPAWLKECREDVFRTGQVDAVRLTHLPTGIAAEGRGHNEAVAKLAHELIVRGRISVNDARAAHNLPPLNPAPDPVPAEAGADG